MGNHDLGERGRFFDRLLWLFPLVYVAHIVEEVPGFASWAGRITEHQFPLWRFSVNNAAWRCCVERWHDRGMLDR